MIEKAQSDAAKIPEVALPQRGREREYLEPARHALYLGVEHKANTADGLEHPQRCILAVLFVVVENDDGCEDNQGQRGSRDQKS